MVSKISYLLTARCVTDLSYDYIYLDAKKLCYAAIALRFVYNLSDAMFLSTGKYDAPHHMKEDYSHHSLSHDSYICTCNRHFVGPHSQ